MLHFESFYVQDYRQISRVCHRYNSRERRNRWIQSIIVHMNLLRTKITHVVLYTFIYLHPAVFMLSIAKFMQRPKHQVNWREESRRSTPLPLRAFSFVTQALPGPLLKVRSYQDRNL